MPQPPRADAEMPDVRVGKGAELVAAVEQDQGPSGEGGSPSLDGLADYVAALELKVVAERQAREELEAQLAATSIEQSRARRAGPVGGRRVLVWLSIVGLVIGILAVIDAFATMVFQEPLSGIFQARAESVAEKKLAVRERAFAVIPTLRGETDQQRNRRLALRLDRRTGTGDEIGRLTIPSIGLKAVMFEGAGAQSLRVGVAHYANTKWPGQAGTVGIAGHRTTFGAPFHKIDKLKPGDKIVVRMPYAKYTYLVEGTKIVTPQTVSVLNSSTNARAAVPGGEPTTQKVVLTSCNPIGSAAQRIVVSGRLVETQTLTSPAQSA